MKTTLGTMPTSLPDGMYCAVNFPILMQLDKLTGDHRLFPSSGASSRGVPLSISAQFSKAMGHDGAVLSGALYEVTIDPDNGQMSGRGFLLDDEHGRRHALAIKTGAMKGNSVGLADIKDVRFVEEMDSGEWWIEFGKFALADTSGVMTPAFADAYAEIEDELKAAFGPDFDPMVELVASSEIVEYRIPKPRDGLTPAEAAELSASFGKVEPYAAFFRPEATRLTKLTFAADGDVYGHLGSWTSCHDGVEGRCVMIPRPADGYASFNKPGVLTERGIVETGPICLLNGHPERGADLEKAYNDPANAWCDVRITEGALGPWISGRSRSLTDDQARIARGSRISGHWKGGKLKGVCSVNAEGFEVPGYGEMVASFSMDADGQIEELIAGFPGCVDGELAAETALQLTVDTPGLVDAVLAKLRESGVIPAEKEPENRLLLAAQMLADEANGPDG